jgi:hypothetical protein
MTVEWSCLELRKIKEVEISSIYGVRAFAAAPTSLTCYPVLSQAEFFSVASRFTDPPAFNVLTWPRKLARS